MKPKHASRLAFPAFILAKSLAAPLVGSIVALVAVQSAHAVDLYWDTNSTVTAGSGAATGTWGTDAFWTTDSTGADIGSPVLTALTTNADNLFIAAGTNGTTGTITVSGTVSANSITFDDNVAIILSGGTAINIGGTTGAGISVLNGANAANTISTGIILNSASTALAVSNAGTGLLTIGAITGSAASTQTLNIGSTNTGGVTLSGIISNGSGGGNVALAVNNTSTGATILSGVNTFTGGVALTAGTLRLGSTTALGATASTLVINGGTLDSNVGNLVLANNNAQTWNGDFAFTGTQSLNLGTGAVSLGSTAGSRTITVNANTLTVGGIISNGTATGLTKSGGGTLFLSGANTYTGPTTLNAGVLVLGAAEIAGTSGPLGTSGGSIVLNGGILRYSNFTNSAPVLNIFDYSSRFSTAANQRYNVDTNSIGQGVVWGANLTSSGGTLTKSGLGTLYLTGANTYDGATAIANGALGVKSLNNVASPNASSSLGAPTTMLNGMISIGSGGDTGRLFYTGAGETTDRVINLAGSTGGAIIEQAGTGALKFTSALTAIAGSKTLTLRGSTAGTGEIAGAIVNGSGASTGLTKSGSGLWTLTGVNLYTGATTVGGGTLTLNSQTGSLAATALTFGNLTGAGGGGTFNIDNVGALTASAQTLGALTFSAGNGRVMTTRTAASDQKITFASLNARTAGATGNFVNTGVNSMTNGFAFTSAPAAGTLLDRGLFYNGSSYASYDALGFVRGYTSTDAAYLAAPTGATIGVSLATSNVDLTTGDISAQTTASANTINLRNSSLTMSAAGQVLSTNGILSSGNSSATLGIATKDSILETTAAGNELVVRVDGSSDQLTLNSVIQNQGGGVTASKITKTGSGALTLTGTNTFTGGTYHNSGTLNINSIGALNSATTDNAVSPGGQGSLLLNNGSTLSNTSGAALTFVSGAYGDHGSDATNRRVSISLNGSVTFDGAADGSKNMFFSRMGDNNVSTVTLLSDSTVNVTNGIFNIGTKMAGGFSLTKNGVGELQVGNFNNTLAFTGGLFLNEGTFTGSCNQFAFGNGMVFLGDLTAGNTKNATLAYSSENQANNNNLLSRDSVTVNAGSSGKLAFVTRNTNVNGFAGISGNVLLNNNLTLAARGLATTTTRISGVVSGSGGLKIGDATNINVGKVNLTGANTYTGVTTLTNGTLTVDNIGNGGVVSSNIGSASNAATNLVFDGGTLQYTGINASTDRNFTINDDKTATVEVTANNLTIAGSSTATTGVMTKTGSGTLTLTGNNSYSGGTIVNAGTLTGIGPSSLGATTGTLGVNNLNTGVGTAVVLNLSTTAATTTGSLSGAKATPSSGTNTATINIGGSQLLTVNQTSAGTYAGVIAGNGSLTLGGLSTNTLTLTGTNTYTGPTAVNAGSLFINGSNTGSGALSVAALATLGGTGSIAGTVNVTGVLSPGGSIQSLASGALTMNSASTFFYEAANNTATGADLMIVNGNLSLTDVSLDLSAANLGLGTWAVGNKLTLMSYTGTGITTGFTGYTDDTTYTGGVFGSNQWVFNYNDTVKGANFNSEAIGTSFVTLTAIPEPDVAMLLGGLGVMSLLFRRRSA